MGCSLGATVSLSAAAVIVAFLTAASAATDAACNHEYAVKHSAGRTVGVSKADDLKACRARQKIAANPEPSGPGGDADTDLAKKTENPIADLISVPFNNYSTFNYRGRGTFNLLEIQPVIPIHLTPDWNVVTRTVVPVVWTPDLSPIASVPAGLAPTDFSAFCRLQFRARLVRLQRPEHRRQLAGQGDQVDRADRRRGGTDHPHRRQAPGETVRWTVLQCRAAGQRRPLGAEYGPDADFLTASNRRNISVMKATYNAPARFHFWPTEGRLAVGRGRAPLCVRSRRPAA